MDDGETMAAVCETADRCPADVRAPRSTTTGLAAAARRWKRWPAGAGPATAPMNRGGRAPKSRRYRARTPMRAEAPATSALPSFSSAIAAASRSA